MTQIIFVEADGTRHEVRADPGLSIMEAAVQNAVPGILADCGGACACATCHVYVDEAWLKKTGEAQSMEASMLEFAEEVRSNSRLSCQLSITDELEGIVLHLPEAQG